MHMILFIKLKIKKMRILSSRSIINIFQHEASLLSKAVKIPLGRWNIDNYSQTTLKIKYANEDNCGVCCKYENIKEKREFDENIIEKEDEKKYIYMMGYESIPT